MFFKSSISELLETCWRLVERSHSLPLVSQTFWCPYLTWCSTSSNQNQVSKFWPDSVWYKTKCQVRCVYQNVQETKGQHLDLSISLQQVSNTSEIKISKKMLFTILFFLYFLYFWRLLRPDRGLFVGSKDVHCSPLRYGIAHLKIGVVVVVWDWLLWRLFVMPPHIIYICSNQFHDQTVWASGEVWISKCLGDQGPTFRPLNQPPTGLQDLWNWTFLKNSINNIVFSLFLRFLEVIEAR